MNCNNTIQYKNLKVHEKQVQPHKNHSFTHIYGFNLSLFVCFFICSFVYFVSNIFSQLSHQHLIRNNEIAQIIAIELFTILLKFGHHDLAMYSDNNWSKSVYCRRLNIFSSRPIFFFFVNSSRKDRPKWLQNNKIAAEHITEGSQRSHRYIGETVCKTIEFQCVYASDWK